METVVKVPYVSRFVTEREGAEWSGEQEGMDKADKRDHSNKPYNSGEKWDKEHMVTSPHQWHRKKDGRDFAHMVTDGAPNIVNTNTPIRYLLYIP